MADNDQERTEQATSRRRDQARQEGNFASSKEVSTLFMVGAGVLVLYFSGLWMFSGLADFKKINPISGFKKIVSLNALAELVKSILKISILTYVVFAAVKKEWANMPMLIDMEVAGSAAHIAQGSLTLMGQTVWVLVVIAILDYAYQRWNFEKGLRMSKEEIKEEMKETEGDPIIKARIKSMQREMARKRMMADVPKADVVVTNPTHIAVAI